MKIKEIGYIKFQKIPMLQMQMLQGWKMKILDYGM